MSTTLEAESTLTDRYQTTVPETVRRALRLKKRDKLQYLIRPSGEVVLTRASDNESDDPVLGQFLAGLYGQRRHLHIVQVQRQSHLLVVGGALHLFLLTVNIARILGRNLDLLNHRSEHLAQCFT